MATPKKAKVNTPQSGGAKRSGRGAGASAAGAGQAGAKGMDPQRPLAPVWRPVLDQIGIPAGQNVSVATFSAMIRHAGGIPAGSPTTLDTVSKVLGQYEPAYWQNWMSTKGGGAGAGNQSTPKPPPGGTSGKQASKPGAKQSSKPGTQQAKGKRTPDPDVLRKRLTALGMTAKDAAAIPDADLQYQVSQLESVTKKAATKNKAAAEDAAQKTAEREKVLERSRQRNKGKGADAIDTSDEGSVGTDSSGRPVESGRRKKGGSGGGDGGKNTTPPPDDTDEPFFYNPFGTHKDAKGRDKPNIGRRIVQNFTIPAGMAAGAYYGGKLAANALGYGQEAPVSEDQFSRWMGDAVRARQWMRQNFGDPGQGPQIDIPQNAPADMPQNPEDTIRRFRSQQ